MPYWHCNLNFEGTSNKNLQDTATSSFNSYCSTLAFTSADTYDFSHFLELYSNLFEKRFSSQILLF